MIGGSPRLLLVRLSAFGDCLHAVPTLVALRRHFPGAEIGWAIEDLPYSLLRDHPLWCMPLQHTQTLNITNCRK